MNYSGISLQSDLLTNAKALADTALVGYPKRVYTYETFTGVGGFVPVGAAIYYGYVNLLMYFAGAAVGDARFTLMGSETFTTGGESFSGRLYLRENIGIIPFNGFVISGITQVYFSFNGYKITYNT